jgi:hypothetical protein
MFKLLGISIVPYSLALALVCGLLRRYHRKGSSRDFPPGPKPLWIIGNALDLPLESFWKKFDEWFKVYGELNPIGQ